VISISLSIVVNLLTLAVVNGFQNEIRRKVTGFSAPLFIQNENNAEFYESDPIHSSKMIEDILSSIDDVQGFNRVAYKPGLIQAIGKRTDVIGLVFKGIDSGYN
jgi:lipoprotein-releasing system permease protein